MKDFEVFLEKRLQKPLPGQRAQRLLQPLPLGGPQASVNYTVRHHYYKSSGVLVPLLKKEDTLNVILTLRSEDIRHGGQISFPGGRCEDNENFIETALREAHEEIGLDTTTVDIVGSLSSLYIDHSRNMVQPVVGFLQCEQKLTANPAEVAEIFSVSMDELLDRRNYIKEKWDLHHAVYTVPYWNIHRVPLWGATAMMMSELVELYKEFLQKEPV